MPKLIDKSITYMPTVTEAQKEKLRQKIFITDPEGNLTGFRDPNTQQIKHLTQQVKIRAYRGKIRDFLETPGSIQTVMPNSISDVMRRWEIGEIDEQERQRLLVELGVPATLTEPLLPFGERVLAGSQDPFSSFFRGVAKGLLHTFGTSSLLPKSVQESAQDIQPERLSEAFGFSMVPGAVPIDYTDPLNTLMFAFPPGTIGLSTAGILRGIPVTARQFAGGVTRVSETILPLERRLLKAGEGMTKPVIRFLEGEEAFAWGGEAERGVGGVSGSFSLNFGTPEAARRAFREWQAIWADLNLPGRPQLQVGRIILPAMQKEVQDAFRRAGQISKQKLLPAGPEQLLLPESRTTYGFPGEAMRPSLQAGRIAEDIAPAGSPGGIWDALDFAGRFSIAKKAGMGHNEAREMFGKQWANLTAQEKQLFSPFLSLEQLDPGLQQMKGMWENLQGGGKDLPPRTPGPPTAPPLTGGVSQPTDNFLDSLVADLPEAEFFINEIQRLAGSRLGQLAQNPLFKQLIGRLDPRLIATTTKPELAYNILLGAEKSVGAQKALKAHAYLAVLDDSQRLFGKYDVHGIIREGRFTGRQITDLLEHGAKNLTKEQQEFRQRIGDIYRGIERLYDRYDIPLELRPLGPTEQHVGRIWYARDLPNGEIGELGFSVGGGRPGAKAGFEKLRPFKTAADAAAAGFRAISPEEAAFINLQRAYNRAAAQISNRWLLGQIPTRTTETAIGKQVTAIQAQKLNEKAVKFKKLLNQAIRSERTPAGSLQSLADDFPKEAQRFRAALATEATKERNRLLEDLKVTVSALIKRTHKEKQVAIGARARARTSAQQPSAGEVPGAQVAPGFSGVIFTGPRAQEAAKTIRKALNPELHAAVTAVNAVNSVARYFVLAGDFSVLNIQLLFLAGASPKVYAQSVKGMTKAFFDTKFHFRYINENLSLIDEFLNSGGLLTSSGMSEFTEAFRRGGILSPSMLKSTLLPSSLKTTAEKVVQLPGKVLQPFQRAFEGAVDIAGVEMWKSLRHMARTPQEQQRLAAFINSFRGVADSAAIGVGAGQRQLESLILLAPRYNRSIAALFIDLGRGDISGELARWYLGKGVAALSAMNVAINVGISIQKGETMEQALARIWRHMNPLTGDFFTWEVGGQKIGPGTKVRSVLQLVARAAKEPSKLLEFSMKSPLVRFVRGNLSLAAGSTTDTVTGHNYIGDPTRDSILDFLENVVARNTLPIWIQSVALEGGGLIGRGVRTVGGIFGYRTYPTSMLDRFRQYAEQYYDMPYEKIDKLKIDQLRRQDTEGKKLWDAYTSEEERRGKVEDGFLLMNFWRNDRIRKLTEEEIKLANHEITPEDYYNFVFETGREFGILLEEQKRQDDDFRQALEGDLSDVPELEFDQDWARYKDIQFDQTLDLGAAGFDFAKRDALFAALQAEVGSERWGRLEEKARISRTELPQEAQNVLQANDLLRDYYDIWKSIVPVADQALYQEYLRQSRSRKDDFVRANPTIRGHVKKVERQKERYLRNPDNALVDALLVKYKGGAPRSRLGRLVDKDLWIDLLSPREIAEAVTPVAMPEPVAP